MQSSNQALIIMGWVLYDVLLSRSTFSTQILLLWHTEMVTTQFGTVSLVGICEGILVGTKIPCFDHRLTIEQSHHHFPRHLKLRHLPMEPMYQEADHRRTTRCCTYHPQVPSRHAFWMLIYLFLVCICQNFGDKCRTVVMACPFWLARRKSTSIQTLEFLQGIFFCGCFWAIGLLEYLVSELVQRHQTLLLRSIH